MSNAMSNFTVPVGPIADPAATESFIVYRAPKRGGKKRVVGASAVLTKAIASHADNHVAIQFHKVGVDGAATPVALTAALGGAESAWVADTPREATLSTVDGALLLLPGEYVTMTYTEAGTVDPGAVNAFLEIAPGV